MKIDILKYGKLSLVGGDEGKAGLDVEGFQLAYEGDESEMEDTDEVSNQSTMEILRWAIAVLHGSLQKMEGKSGGCVTGLQRTQSAIRITKQ